MEIYFVYVNNNYKLICLTASLNLYSLYMLLARSHMKLCLNEAETAQWKCSEKIAGLRLSERQRVQPNTYEAFMNSNEQVVLATIHFISSRNELVMQYFNKQDSFRFHRYRFVSRKRILSHQNQLSCSLDASPLPRHVRINARMFFRDAQKNFFFSDTWLTSYHH